MPQFKYSQTQQIHNLNQGLRIKPKRLGYRRISSRYCQAAMKPPPKHSQANSDNYRQSQHDILAFICSSYNIQKIIRKRPITFMLYNYNLLFFNPSES